MTYRELLVGLKNNTINVNQNGHKSFYIDNLIHDLEHYVSYWDENTSTFFNGDNDVNNEFYKHILSLTDNFDCGNCGIKLLFNYTEENNTLNVITGKANKIFKFDYNEGNCPYKNKKVVSFNFNVTDTVIFSNIFRYLDNTIENLERKDKLDIEGLNNFAGRKELTKFYAKHNCGYQQTTNCSAYLFLNTNKDEILVIVDSIVYDEENHYEYNAEEELPKLGYEYLGDISCDVWRYMFINKCDLTSQDASINKDKIEVELKKGDYKVYNYFDSSERDKHKIGKFYIASRIKLK